MIIRVKSLFVILVCCGLLLSADGELSAQIKKQAGVRTVVIDPGHGGTDPGAVYGGVKEKDINLKVALKLGNLIAEGCADVKVVYTRDKDVAVGLAERGNIANKAAANLFISIHSDAAENKSARGSTTFIMGMDKQDKNLAEAMRENAVMKYEDDYTEKYEGFDPTSAESYIIFSLMQHADFDQSLLLAQTIQKHYKTDTAMADRGSKQGPFYVLWKPAMPRVLTEMGFLSNETDRKYLNSEKGQNAMAKALYTAFVEYKQAVEKSWHGTTEATLPAEKAEPQSVVTLAPTPPPAETKPAPAEKPQVKTSAEVGFYVQLCASRTQIPTNDSRFGKHSGKIVEKYIDGWYKYYLGGYQKLTEAVATRDEVKKGSFKEAFVVALDGDTPVTIDEARRRIAEK
jgi:N-acetylmuramoyl-L-alanine amidase